MVYLLKVLRTYPKLVNRLSKHLHTFELLSDLDIIFSQLTSTMWVSYV